MSTGDIAIHGNRIDYLLRMPEYEMRPGVDPATAIFGNVRFRSARTVTRLEWARLEGAECHLDSSRQQYLCGASYVFAGPPGDIEVECQLFRSTVANHVHMLRAERDGKFDQAILDSSFPTATLTFRPPTALGIAVGQIAAGAYRVVSGLTQMLLLCTLAFGARSTKERFVLAGAFIAGECASAIWLLRVTWQPSPRFAEAAVALALAYLGLELLVWPKAGGRWLLGLLFGGFAGIYFALFVGESGYRAGYVLGGAVLAGVFTFAICGGFARILRHRLGTVPWIRQTACSSVLALGAVWFCIRLVR